MNSRKESVARMEHTETDSPSMLQTPLPVLVGCTEAVLFIDFVQGLHFDHNNRVGYVYGPLGVISITGDTKEVDHWFRRRVGWGGFLTLSYNLEIAGGCGS